MPVVGTWRRCATDEKDRQIGIPALTTALLLTGSPMLSDAPPPVVAAVSAVVEQQVPVAPPPIVPPPPVPVGPTVPVDPALPADPAVPADPAIQTLPVPAAPLPPASPDAPPVPVAPPGAAASSDPAALQEGNDIVVVGRSRRGDPLEPLNAQSFEAAQAVDEAVVGPVALAYKKNVPSPIRSGLRNFLANLREPVVAVNYLLQLKPGKAGETLGRFAINSTVGIAGVLDVAKKKPFRLPRRRNGFANTLGYYGVKPGPFFFLPLIGPTTLRDLVGNTIDQVVPIGPIRPFNGQAYTIPVAVLSALDYRAEFDEELETIRAKQDPYAAARRFYLARRQAEIDALKGKRPAPDAPRPILPAVLDTDPVPGGTAADSLGQPQR